MEPLERPFEQLEFRLGVSFRNRTLLKQALTHRSYLNENTPPGSDSNERLEFLGDAVIDLAVGRALFERLPVATEGSLTARRSLAVRGDALARAARQLGLGQVLFLGSGEQAAGGAERTGNLAGVFEAIVGAVLLDQGHAAAAEFTLRVLKDEVEAAIDTESPKDPKSLLQEFAQSRGEEPPEYHVTSFISHEQDPVWHVEAVLAGRVVAKGQGRRKLDAELEAAGAALSGFGKPTGTS